MKVRRKESYDQSDSDGLCRTVLSVLRILCAMSRQCSSNWYNRVAVTQRRLRSSIEPASHIKLEIMQGSSPFRLMISWVRWWSARNFIKVLLPEPGLPLIQNKPSPERSRLPRATLLVLDSSADDASRTARAFASTAHWNVLPYEGSIALYRAFLCVKLRLSISFWICISSFSRDRAIRNSSSVFSCWLLRLDSTFLTSSCKFCEALSIWRCVSADFNSMEERVSLLSARVSSVGVTGYLWMI